MLKNLLPKLTQNKKILLSTLGILAMVFILISVSRLTTSYVITHPDPGLSAEERRELTAELAEIEAKIQEINNDIDVGEKYALYVRQAEILSLLGDHKGAIKAMETILDDNQENATVWFRLAEFQKKAGDYNRAATSISNALDNDPEATQYWLMYFDLLINHTGADHGDIDRMYNSAFFETGFNNDIIISYAQFMEITGNLQAAYNYWNMALQNNPEGVEIYQAEMDRLQAEINVKYKEEIERMNQ